MNVRLPPSSFGGQAMGILELSLSLSLSLSCSLDFFLLLYFLNIDHFSLSPSSSLSLSFFLLCLLGPSFGAPVVNPVMGFANNMVGQVGFPGRERER